MAPGSKSSSLIFMMALYVSIFVSINMIMFIRCIHIFNKDTILFFWKDNFLC